MSSSAHIIDPGESINVGEYFFAAVDVLFMLTGNKSDTKNITKSCNAKEKIKVHGIARKHVMAAGGSECGLALGLQSSIILLSVSGLRRIKRDRMANANDAAQDYSIV